MRVDLIVRNADAFRQSEVRRTGSDTARANAEVTGLGNVESALEQSGIYGAITGFVSALQKLKEDPVDTSLRASVIESARTMGATFQIAAKEMDAVGKGLRFEAADGVTQVNRIAGELARTNLRLARAADASSDQTALLDQRDKLLADLSQYGDIATTMAQDGSVTVTLGTSAAGTPLVSGGDTKALAMTTAGDGTVSYTLDSGALTLAGGSLAGQQLALGKLAHLGTDLDTLAGSIVTTVNTDLDTEGVNLVRYQQAFQASGRVMQVAASLFDSLLQIR